MPYTENQNAVAPKVSVIVVTYGRPDYLQQALESVCQQTFTDYEIIVVDDCSGPEIVNQYHLPAGAQLICHETRKGNAGAGRNTGARAARGEYLAFLDMDDAWLAHKLASQVQILDAHPETALTYCHCIYVNDELVPLEKQAPTHKSPAPDTLRQLLHGSIIKSPSGVMIRKSAYAAVGGADESLYSTDRDLWLRLARHHRFHSDPTPGFLYRRHPGQKTKNKSAMIYSGIRVLEKAREWLPQERPDLARLLRSITGRTLCAAARRKLQEGANQVEVMSLLRRSLQVWPWAPRTYLLWAKAYLVCRHSAAAKIEPQ
jgi:glycosyltransferase involved in cell wall biosynthesis